MTRMLRSFLLLAVALGLASSAGARNLTAHLSGGEEVPTVDTTAVGQAILKIRGDTLEYKLIVADIANVVAAHIHCAPAGANGPVGVTLFGGAPVSTSGILAQGPILAPDGGNACGWADVADVIDALLGGDTYVNVHTLANLGGEVRGQVD